MVEVRRGQEAVEVAKKLRELADQVARCGAAGRCTHARLALVAEIRRLNAIAARGAAGGAATGRRKGG